MKKFGKLVCMCLLAMSVVGCSSEPKVEYETVKSVEKGKETVGYSIQAPEGEYIIKDGKLGLDILKGDKVIGSVVSTSVDTSWVYENTESIKNYKVETKDGVEVKTFNDDKSYGSYQKVSDDLYIMISSDTAENRDELVKNLKFVLDENK